MCAIRHCPNVLPCAVCVCWLQALPAGVRGQYAERWTALESSLGRPSFHALFDHFVVVEQAATASNSTQARSSSSQLGSSNGSGAGATSYQGFVPAGSSLINHRQHEAKNGSNSSSSSAAAAGAASSNGSNGGSSSNVLPALMRPDVLQHFSSHPDVEAALDQVLEYGQRLLLLRANDWSALAAEGGSGEGRRCVGELGGGCALT